MEDERPRLRPSDPAVERDQLLEGTAFLEIGVVEAADHDVGHVSEPVGAQQVPRRVRRERRQRILALDGSLGEVVGAGGAEYDRTALRRADEEPADVRVRAERRDQPRVALVDLLEREPARLLHQRDEAEVSRAEHDDVPVRDVVLRALALLLVGPPGRLADGQADHRVLLVAAGDLLDGPLLERALDELVEPVAVPLLEGRSLRLAVVGQHDDLVGTRRVAARAVDAPELLVELPQRLEGVCALEPRVMGDLVVARERRIDGRPAAHHVRQHAVDDQVPDDHAHRAAHERIDAAAVASRAAHRDGSPGGRRSTRG